jgi:hypothetical protein
MGSNIKGIGCEVKLTKFDVLASVTMKVGVLQDVKPCSRMKYLPKFWRNVLLPPYEARYHISEDKTGQLDKLHLFF